MTAVSVVIPTFNQGAFLGEAIESALSQTERPREVVVVDDGSTDDTPALLRSYAGEVEVLRQANLGVAAARNAGARRTTGRYLTFLDSDDVWLPRKLELQRSVLDSDPSVGLVHCAVEEIDGTGRPLGRSAEGLEGDVAIDMVLLRRPVVLGGGSGFMVRRELFEAVGGFDETLSTSADWDLCFRVAQRCRTAFVPDVCLRYRVHSANMHRDVDVMRADMRRAFAKAFVAAPPNIAAVRRKAYARLHIILAGSYLEAGRRATALRHLASAIRSHPSDAGRDVLDAVRHRLCRARSLGRLTR